MTWTQYSLMRISISGTWLKISTHYKHTFQPRLHIIGTVEDHMQHIMNNQLPLFCRVTFLHNTRKRPYEFIAVVSTNPLQILLPNKNAEDEMLDHIDDLKMSFSGSKLESVLIWIFDTCVSPSLRELVILKTDWGCNCNLGGFVIYRFWKPLNL